MSTSTLTVQTLRGNGADASNIGARERRVLVQIELFGRLTGRIWMPAAECQKDLHATFTISDERFRPVLWYGKGSAESFRDAVMQATDDGDFQSARLTADTSVIVRRTVSQGMRTETRTREFAATELPSIADLVAADTFSAYDEMEG